MTPMTPALAAAMLIAIAQEQMDDHECDTAWCYSTMNDYCGYRHAFSTAIETIADLIPPDRLPRNWSELYRQYATPI